MPGTIRDEIAVGRIGVRVLLDMEEALSAIFEKDGRCIPGFAVAVNPEKVVLSEEDPYILTFLQSATLRFADGIGVVLAMRAKGARVNRIPGCELWERVIQRAALHHTPVFLVGAKPKTLVAVRERLATLHPELSIVGAQHGYFKAGEEPAVIRSIVDSGARIVTVAMGSPRQEEFITRARACHPDAFYMGVGGTFDVFAGAVRRAPALARALQLEWLYRLLSNPRRVWRQRRLVKFGLRLVLGRV